MATTQAFHDRFAAQLTALLGDGFEVRADRSLTVASFGKAALLGWTPEPSDKRKPVGEDDAREWVASAVSRLRSEIPKYTDEAKAHARVLLDELATRGI